MIIRIQSRVRSVGDTACVINSTDGDSTDNGGQIPSILCAHASQGCGVCRDSQSFRGDPQSLKSSDDRGPRCRSASHGGHPSPRRLISGPSPQTLNSATVWRTQVDDEPRLRQSSASQPRGDHLPRPGCSQARSSCSQIGIVGIAGIIKSLSHVDAMPMP